jgi:dipeptidase
MCDTAVAMGSATADGSVVFGKNSDREPNEAHMLLHVPATDYPAGARLRCTHMEIPQVRKTLAVMLAKPFWIWGAEIGANESGVVIGNEALFTRVPCDRETGLLGMDLLRLGLERGQNAAAALEVITELLEEHGQGGNCGYSHPFYYHNSFLIADKNEAWVLETAGRHWAAEQVKEIRTISNGITIGHSFDLSSKGLVLHAVRERWLRRDEDFHFARCYSSPLYTKLSDAETRQSRTTARLERHRGQITPAVMMAALRDHGCDDDAGWSPDRGLLGMSVCMHAGFGPIRTAQTTGSMVSHLQDDRHTHWVTGTAAPCLSVFKPFWFDGGPPDIGPRPTGQYDDSALFWKHEALHRSVLRDFTKRRLAVCAERETLEQSFIAEAQNHADSPARRCEITRRCFGAAELALDGWNREVNTPPSKRASYLYLRTWNRLNTEAGLAL